MRKIIFGKLTKQIMRYIQVSKEDEINLEDLCGGKIKKKYKGFSDLEIAENSSIVIEKVRTILNRINQESNDRGVPPKYEFVKYPPNILIKHSLLHGENGFSHVREHNNDILNTIREMNWRSFEFLCEHLLKINNIIISEVTCGKKEGGIDFYGLLEMTRFSPCGVLLRDARIRVIGQAKRHQNKVDDKEVREFKTHRDDLLEETGRAINKLPKWFTKSKDPLLSFFIVTNKFTKGATAYANKNGINLKDGEQVMEDIIKSPNAREWFNRKEGKLVFDKKLFNKFFKKDNVK